MNSEALLTTIAANVKNGNLSDNDFRQFIENSLAGTVLEKIMNKHKKPATPASNTINIE